MRDLAQKANLILHRNTAIPDTSAVGNTDRDHPRAFCAPSGARTLTRVSTAFHPRPCFRPHLRSLTSFHCGTSKRDCGRRSVLVTYSHICRTLHPAARSFQQHAWPRTRVLRLSSLLIGSGRPSEAFDGTFNIPSTFFYCRSHVSGSLCGSNVSRLYLARCAHGRGCIAD